ncbi:putative metal-binding motif-containing protein [Xanthomarina sp.]|uniref:putative metal-binding motif-containing protein n=1 Tax=Xanthomarina sp. TaxID=1931211 RepID=UPI002CF85DE7|nr:putative metal-binding motif-containing protein [Xanthomarina sp.]HLV39149.1 putative metal-binding motif-containing protein [Xanthomarina sp.]
MKNQILKFSVLVLVLFVVACGSDDETSCIEQTWYFDMDGDSYGNPEVSKKACTQPDGYVLDNTDCNDAEPSINPGRTEVTSDGIDNNCNGIIDECSSDSDCTGVCLNGTCHVICETDSDCPPGTTCVDLGNGLKVCQ